MKAAQQARSMGLKVGDTIRGRWLISRHHGGRIGASTQGASVLLGLGRKVHAP